MSAEVVEPSSRAEVKGCGGSGRGTAPRMRRPRLVLSKLTVGRPLQGERAVGAVLTYIGATTRSGAMAYPYLLTLKLTRGGANVQRTPSQLSRALLKNGQDIYGADLTSSIVFLAIIGAEQATP